MVSEEKNQEMSVDEILSSIKEVISNETASITDNSDNEILELTDVVSGEDDSILLDDIVDKKVINEVLKNDDSILLDDVVDDEAINEGLTGEDLRKNSNLDGSNFLSDLSIDSIIKETVKETLNEWFSKNLKPIVEESVKEEIAKLFKKRN
jgi:cell pole-organizing protein PopZ